MVLKQYTVKLSHFHPLGPSWGGEMTTAGPALRLAVCLAVTFLYPLPATAEAPESIVVHDLTGLRALDLSREEERLRLWDTCHVVSALQGLVNRSEPRLYIRFIEPWDSYWLRWMASPGHWLESTVQEEVEGLEALLERFREAYRGVVVYDREPACLSNVASTIAGVENLLPVRKDAREGSLYHRIVLEGPRLEEVVDLTARAFPEESGSRKCAPYLWAQRTYLDTGRCDPRYLAYYVDAYWLRDPFRGNAENHTLTNHDFFVARRAFFFDLGPWDDETPVDDPGQKPGEDVRTLQSILRATWSATGGNTIVHVGGFVPWAWKYCNHAPGAGRHPPVATEWRYAEILSAYNAMMDADALGPCAMANASFFTHFPLADAYPQRERPDDEALRKAGLVDTDGLVAPGAYLCFYVGDYDSAAWLYREFPRCWNTPGRGSVPLGWALNPNLERRAPMALVYARETASPLDVFTAGDSGAGYLNPGALETPRPYSGLPSAVDVWERFCRGFYERWDLSVTGFVIDGSSRGMGPRAWDAYARFSPGGIGGQKMPPQGVHKGMPYIRVGHTSGSARAAAEQFAAMISPERRSFYYIRTILKTADWHKELAEELAALQPAARIVDPHTFFALLERYEEDRDRYPRPVWKDATVSWEPGGEKGLRPIPYEDGPIRVESVASRRAVVSRGEGRNRYVYLGVHDGFPAGEPENLVVEVTYLDSGTGRFAVHYNGTESAYRATAPVKVGESGAWKTASVRLEGAQLANQQNACADLRLEHGGGTLAVSKILIRRAPEEGEAVE